MMTSVWFLNRVETLQLHNIRLCLEECFISADDEESFFFFFFVSRLFTKRTETGWNQMMKHIRSIKYSISIQFSVELKIKLNETVSFIFLLSCSIDTQTFLCLYCNIFMSYPVERVHRNVSCNTSLLQFLIINHKSFCCWLLMRRRSTLSERIIYKSGQKSAAHVYNKLLNI